MLCKLISIRLKGLLSKSTGKGGAWLQLLLICTVLVGVGGICAAFYFMFSAIAQALHATPLAWFYFALVGLLSFGISFFFTALAAKSELFDSKDTELLLSLPIKPRTILLSRLSMFLGSEYLFSFAVMVPAGIAWGIHAGFSFLPLYILGSLCLPLLTAALASLVGWLLALITANTRRKNLLTVLFSLIFMGLYIYVYSNMNDYVNQIITRYQEFSESMMGWGFLFHWFGLGIAEADIAHLLAVIGIALFAFALAVWALSHGFLRISSRSTVHKRKSANVTYAAAGSEKALLKREFQRLLSLPVYMLNCGLGVLMIVVLAVFLLLKADDLKVLLSTLPVSNMSISYLCAMLVALMSSMCCFTAPSISLEGKTLWILRSAPIDAQKILNAKLYMHLILSTPSLLILSVVAGIVFEASYVGWALYLLLPQLMNVLAAQFGLMMNLLFPKFDWTNAAVPVKQSLSVFLAMLMPMLLSMGAVACVLLLDVNIKLFTLATVLLLTLLNVLCAMWLEYKGADRFDRLQ